MLQIYFNKIHRIYKKESKSSFGHAFWKEMWKAITHVNIILEIIIKEPTLILLFFVVILKGI